MKSASHDGESTTRQALRRSLLEARERFVAGPAAADASLALGRHLAAVVAQLEPASLGVYWPHRSEFNAAAPLAADSAFAKIAMSLPYARRVPVQMHYRAWDRRAPSAVDECGIATTGGAEVVPEVVLVPCVGFTRSGFRLGYGGGYFDRWLTAHPHVTAVGVAWACAEIDAAAFNAAPHDRPLAFVVTEHGAG